MAGLNGQINCGINFNYVTANAFGTQSDSFNPAAQFLFTDGTGDNQANLYYYFGENLIATTRTLDLTSLPGTFGTVTFAKVKFIYIMNMGIVDGVTLNVGNAGSDPWYAPWDASTTIEKVMPSSAMLKSNLLSQTTNPWTVDGTHKNLLLDAGASSIEYVLCIVGI